ncbi:hypothetical protein CHCC15337_1571 [Bacillus paralicheniformis]|nr:hypothetical protein CHCC5021_0963 [Bacillus paralicheniformis]TWL07141.1 hypothetical protein CHCC19468_3408 [Bacillus paralicheniformis]TWL08635.1 hypothetical protein CHCC19467_4230 [Bacillus paralicheniformis]TWL40473.1 hypothetical protein CHCC15337_1571 [Bacillus paralicheniformis]TWL53678.1 hypothetical protein CHCC15332_0610 [Bacillus paralicheniformis]
MSLTSANINDAVHEAELQAAQFRYAGLSGYLVKRHTKNI